MTNFQELLMHSEDVKIKVLEKFGRTPETVKDDIQSIKEWAKKQPHFPEIPNDKYILAFLLLSKFEFAKAKRTIDLYYTSGGTIPELVKDPEAPEVQDIMDFMYWIPLPKLATNNIRVVVQSFKKSKKPTVDSAAYFAHVINMLQILTTEDPGTYKTVLFDGSNIQSPQLSFLSPIVIKKLFHMYQKIYAGQLYQMHLVNLPPIMEPLLILFKTIMKPKLAEKIFYHKNIESVFEYIPKEILPADYGGEEATLEALLGLWKIKIKEIAPIIRHNNQLRTDESKRLGVSPLSSEFLELEGNFRKLNVD